MTLVAALSSLTAGTWKGGKGENGENGGKCPVGGIKKGGGVRGGGGICPAKAHSAFNDIDLAEAQDLARVVEGKARILTKIPDDFRLECTGLRVEGLQEQGAEAEEHPLVRATISASAPEGVKNLQSGSSNHPIDLKARRKAEWSGLHVKLDDDDSLVAVVQTKIRGVWKEATSARINPMQAFVVEDQDVVWHKESVRTTNGRSCTVWVELSLLRKTSQILAQLDQATVLTKQRNLKAVHFEAKRRTPEQIKEEEDMLQELSNEEGTMTFQDKVYMKDIWNKTLGWIELTGEFIVDGLFLRCPDLLQIVGATAAELMFDMMISLIDLSIRALDERTEVIARESYHAMPLMAASDRPFVTLKEGFEQFAALGMRPRHWKEARIIFLLAMEKANPYLEEADAEILEGGKDSCAYKFWNQSVMLPALRAIKEIDDMYESEENRQLLKEVMEPVLEDKVVSGQAFYKQLFQSHPDLLKYFGTTDMNFLAGHLFDALELLVESVNDFQGALGVLIHLGRIHDNARIATETYPAIAEVLDATLRSVGGKYGDGSETGEKAVKVWSHLIERTCLVVSRVSFVSERLLRKAYEWSAQVAYELELGDAFLQKRKIDIEEEVRYTGTYTHTEEEIVHGARVAWRNSAKCVGRIAWNTMLVRDRRHVTDLKHIFAECIEHQRLATADGSLKAVMTVFQPRKPGTRLGMRFWNLQLIRFACYEMPDGSFMGDKANLQYTKECIEFGWNPPEPRSEFDVLPIVIEDTVRGLTEMFEVPKEYHKVTMIEHPKFPEFAKLGLRWCVVPTVTCFTMSLGGLQYTCCPFNGWFMEAEITRDLLEPGRMDKMEPIARALGIDSTDEDDFWRERVAIETNKAIVHSFRRDGNSIVDHVTAQAQFLAHDMREKREGREVPAQWSWVVPSFGGSTLPIWHHEMRDFYIEPAYEYQAEVTAMRQFSSIPESDMIASDAPGGVEFEKILILYGSVTGTAEGYAYKAKKMLRPLQVDVKSCSKVKVKELQKEFKANGGQYSGLLMICSTFGEGHPATNAVEFFESLKTLPASGLSGVPYSVMAIGSRVYPDYCQSGIDFDKLFNQAGAERMLPVKKADELDGQEGTVMQWIGVISSMYDVEQKRALVMAGDVDASGPEGPSVEVTLLEDDDPKVQEAVAEEQKLVATVSAKSSDAGAAARFLPDGYSLCRVTRNTELVDFSQAKSPRDFKSTRFLEFDLKGISRTLQPSQLQYQTGDHAKMVPSNPKDLVQGMCNCLKLKASSWVHVKVQEGEGRPLTSPVARVSDIFTYELDLATQDKDGNLPFITKMLVVAREVNGNDNTKTDKSSEELAQLENLVEGLDQNATPRSLVYKEAGEESAATETPEDSRKAAITLLMDTYVTIPSLLKEFPITASNLSLADCIETLPRIKPRHYSIASSSELHESSLQLTVGVLDITHKTTGNIRHGLCSNYLKGVLPQETFVRMGVNTSSFRLPSDMTSPIVMVGPGTGISPMVGFLQAREKAMADGVKVGKCMVLFGCRSEADFLHSSQMRTWQKSGVITSLQVAFSRKAGQPKEYVQHRISKIQEDVWAILRDPKCHYYVCGDSNMAEDVYDELFRTVRGAGKLSHKEAWAFFQRMKKEHRFQNDTWGVVSKIEEGLARQAEKKYNQAEAWLETFTAESQDGQEQDEESENGEVWC